MDTMELFWTAIRSAGLYVLMLIVIRLLGKRTIGNFTAFDLLVALMLGEVVDEIIYGEVNFLNGMVAIVVIAGAKYLTGFLSFSFPTLNKILDGIPTILVKKGNFEKKGMKSELMSDREVMAALRLKDVEDIREVKLAILEVDGEVSVIREDWAEPIQKQDLNRDKSAAKDPIPEEKSTVSKYALNER